MEENNRAEKTPTPPGLIHDSYSELEVVPLGPGHKKVIIPQVYPQPTRNNSSDQYIYPVESVPEKQEADRICGLKAKRFWLALSAILFLLCAVAIIVGCLVGLKHQNSGSSTPTSAVSQTTGTPSNASSSAATPTSIRENSKLAVTGWARGADCSIRLFFQDDEDYIKIVGYESSTGEWNSPSRQFKTKARTAMSVTHIDWAWYGQDAIQVEMFYVDEYNILREWNWQETSYNGGNGSLSPLGIEVGGSSQVTTYWPSIIYQDTAGSLREILYNASMAVSGWSLHVLDVKALVGTSLVQIPISQAYTGAQLFYQRDDGRLIDYGWNNTLSEWLKNDWKPGTFEELVPAGVELGALALPRPGSIMDLDLYILWQDTSGVIQVMWQDDSSGWKGPSTYSAFDGADNGTSIACIAPGSYYNLPLNDVSGLARCYFQSNRAIREVTYSDSSWAILGEVPIP